MAEQLNIEQLRKFAPQNPILAFSPLNTGSPMQDWCAHLANNPLRRMELEEFAILGDVVVRIADELEPDPLDRVRIMSLEYAVRVLGNEEDGREFVRCIDLSFAQAAVVMPKEHNKLRIIQVGAGGTGSFAALAFARLMYELKELGKAAELLIVDPDRVESGNIPRSNFCSAEIGSYKAQTLAKRITLAWGLECHYANEQFDAEVHLKQSSGDYRTLTVIVGCVDNHLARREMHVAVEKHQGYRSDEAANVWWIDGGNGRFSGQVLLGSNTKPLKTAKLFVGSSICRSLPAPSLVHPELLTDQEKETRTLAQVSCPERIRLGEQSLNVNQRVAVEIGEMLAAMFLTRNLRRFATYFDLETGTSRSLYCTPDHIESVIPKRK